MSHVHKSTFFLVENASFSLLGALYVTNLLLHLSDRLRSEMISTSIVCLATAAAYFSRIILECSVAVDVGGQPFPGIVSHLFARLIEF